MDILIIGLGVSEQLMVLCSKRAGHNVAHYIREGSNKKQLSLPVFTATVPVS